MKQVLLLDGCSIVFGVANVMPDHSIQDRDVCKSYARCTIASSMFKSCEDSVFTVDQQNTIRKFAFDKCNCPDSSAIGIFCLCCIFCAL